MYKCYRLACKCFIYSHTHTHRHAHALGHHILRIWEQFRNCYLDRTVFVFQLETSLFPFIFVFGFAYFHFSRQDVATQFRLALNLLCGQAGLKLTVSSCLSQSRARITGVPAIPSSFFLFCFGSPLSPYLWNSSGSKGPILGMSCQIDKCVCFIADAM